MVTVIKSINKILERFKKQKKSKLFETFWPGNSITLQVISRQIV